MPQPMTPHSSSITTPIQVAWNATEWANAIASLPAEDPLPVRTVIVPNGRVAHSLRRELLRMGRGGLLAGTLFRTFQLCAEDVLRGAGIRFSTGEEVLRPTRLATLFREELPLDYFKLDLLRNTRGWENAFARTISDLEAAGLRPDDLTSALGSDRRWRDVSTIWRRLEELAGPSWSSARTLREAADRLESDPALWPHDGDTLVPAASDAPAVMARLIKAIPRMHLLLLPARPLRRRYLDRVERLLGGDARTMLEAATHPRSGDTEKQILGSYLFEPGEVIGDPLRPRSSGPDGTVSLEESSGVDEEIDSAVRWVAREVLERRTPLEDIAVLTPSRDHVLDLLAARLAELPWEGGDGFPVFVAGGRPLVSFASGARALAVVRALRAHLAAETMVPLLPALRLTNSEVDAEAPAHLSHDQAVRIAYGLGTLGGNPANPRGALDWTGRLEARRRAIEGRLGAEPPPTTDTEEPDDRDRIELARTLDTIRRVSSSVGALADVSRQVVDGASLRVVWDALRTFLTEWVASAGGRFDVVHRLEEAISPLCADERCAALVGQDALRAIEEVLLAVRLTGGRYGGPAVYVGPIDGALGLRFTATRVVGLLEGALPSQPSEDPVLPDALRTADPRIPRTEDRAISQLHALDRVVRDAERIVLSTPHVDARRSEREPSSIFIEAAAALGRPNAITGEASRDHPIPDMTALQRDAFRPARRSGEASREESPLVAADWQQLVAARGAPLPSGWGAAGALDLARMRRLRSPAGSPGPLDGLLTADAAILALVPGLTMDRPTSASALKTFLECPHHLLYERVLRFREPARPPELGKIDNLSYGSLLHLILEELFNHHGKELCSRERGIEHWQEIARQIASRKLEELLESYPLLGDQVRAQQHAQVLRDLATFLEYEWSEASRSFARAELPFGYPEPLRLDFDDGSLFVRGRVDRVDVEGGRTLVRDLKTGKSHPRSGKESAADHRRDVQLALYGMVLRRLAGELGLPERIAAAYAYMDPHEPERAFRDDFDELEENARIWLSAARRLLGSAAFPRTTDQKDCAYCAFRPVCGPDPYARALEVLEALGETGAPFVRMKVGGSEADEPLEGAEG